MLKINKDKIIKIILVLIVLVGFVFLLWANNSYKALPEARRVIKEEKSIEIESINNNFIFKSRQIKNTGIIIYPGARVEAEAYSFLAKKIAKEGYSVFLADMPLNLAILDYDRAEKIINKNPEIDNWVLIGHSLGGAMAARFIDNNLEKISALVLLASYPAENNNLSESEVSVLSIYGSHDGVINNENLINSKTLLPEDTIFKEVVGGNHTQFAYYELQRGDNKAEITREKQHKLIISVIKEFLLKI